MLLSPFPAHNKILCYLGRKQTLKKNYKENKIENHKHQSLKLNLFKKFSLMLSLQHLKGMQNIFLVCLLIKQGGKEDQKKRRKEILRLLIPFKHSYFFIPHKTLLRIRSEHTNLFSKSDSVSQFCYECSFAGNVPLSPSLGDPKVNAESCHSGHLC